MKHNNIEDIISHRKLLIHIFWACTIFFSILIICVTIAFIDQQGFNISFTMDNNTLEAIKSFNYTAILEAQK